MSISQSSTISVDSEKNIKPSVDVVVYSLGCKTNQYEGEALVAEFGIHGVRASEKMQQASVYIINTCSVTVEADRKSRQICRRAKSLNKDAVVYVCGCAVAMCTDEYFAEAKVIAGAMDKTKIVNQILSTHKFEKYTFTNTNVQNGVSSNNSNIVSNTLKHSISIPYLNKNTNNSILKNIDVSTNSIISKNSVVSSATVDSTVEQVSGPCQGCASASSCGSSSSTTALNSENSALVSESSNILSNINVTRHARKHIKIQDGCNDFCSFCIIPFLRGRSRSRTVDDVVREIRETDTNEIVLTGINITRYGDDNGCTLTQLVQNIETDARIRISSIECNAINWELLDAMVRNNGCNHFHLSLQSGSDKVLRAMNRKYNVEHFVSKVELIRRMMGSNSAITTDIIVGYPSENEKDFEDTLNLVDQIQFSDVHAFKFSPRPKTVAARLPQLPSHIVDARFEKLRQKINYHKSNFLNKQLGTTHEVVFENVSNSAPSGYTRNYCKVECRDAKPNSVGIVTIVGIDGETLIGELVSMHNAQCTMHN